MEYVADELGVELLTAAGAPARALAARRLARRSSRCAGSSGAGGRTSSTRTRPRRARRAGSPRSISGRARPRAIVHTYHGHVLSGYFSRRWERVFRLIERMLAYTSGTLVAVSDEVRDDLVRFGVAPRRSLRRRPVRLRPAGLERRRRRVAPEAPRGDRSRRRDLRRRLGRPAHRDQAAARPDPDAARAPRRGRGRAARARRRRRGPRRRGGARGRARGRRPLPARRLPEEHPALVRVLRRAAAHVGERGHARRRDRGAGSGTAGRGDPGGRHRNRRPERRERLPGGDRRHAGARRPARGARAATRRCGERMGAAGAEDVRARFAVGRMADEVEAIYDRLLR